MIPFLLAGAGGLGLLVGGLAAIARHRPQDRESRARDGELVEVTARRSIIRQGSARHPDDHGSGAAQNFAADGRDLAGYRVVRVDRPAPVLAPAAGTSPASGSRPRRSPS